MPRATRAAARAQEQAEEAATAASIALPPTPTKERKPLGEISHNSNAVFEMVVTPKPDDTKSDVKVKKGKGAKKGKKGKKPKPDENPIEILEDEDRSSHSDAADEARDLLLDTTHSAVHDQFALPDDSISSHSIAAVDMAAQELSPQNHTSSKVDVVPAPEPTRTEVHGEQPTVSMDTSIANVTASEKKAALDLSKEDSFVERIHSRSPAKRVSRIEDSVEALDALEDAIEKVGEAIPASGSELSSPNETRKPTKKQPLSKKRTDLASTPSARTPKLSRTGLAPSVSSKATPSKAASRPTALSTKQSAPRASAITNRAPASNKTIAETASKPKAPAKRVSSIHKTPFQPVKSSKPPTKSTFELPGEAVARKLKEQREQRQKREEQSLTKSVHANTRGPQKRPAPEVKMTATSRARLSLAQHGLASGAKPSNSFDPTPKAGTKTTIRPMKSDKSVLVPTKARAPASANTSAKRGSPLKTSPISRQMSTSSQPRSAGDSELANHKIRGKEVFSRPKQMLKAKEDERKAKEESAKKARIEAAERGRLASREWAEKQKARKLAAEVSKKTAECEPTAI